MRNIYFRTFEVSANTLSGRSPSGCTEELQANSKVKFLGEERKTKCEFINVIIWARSLQSHLIPRL